MRSLLLDPEPNHTSDASQQKSSSSTCKTALARIRNDGIVDALDRPRIALRFYDDVYAQHAERVEEI